MLLCWNCPNGIEPKAIFTMRFVSCYAYNIYCLFTDRIIQSKRIRLILQNSIKFQCGSRNLPSPFSKGAEHICRAPWTAWIAYWTTETTRLCFWWLEKIWKKRDSFYSFVIFKSTYTIQLNSATRQHQKRFKTEQNAFMNKVLLEHRLHGDNRIAVWKRVFFRWIGKLFIHHDDVFRQCNSCPEEIIQT